MRTNPIAVLKGGMLASALLVAGQVQAALVAFGSDGSGLPVGQTITEPSGGVSSPGFSGTLFLEVFDSAGGTFSRTGDVVGTTGGDYTYVFQLVMDADSDGQAALISDITLNAYQLGSGDTGNPAGSFGPGPTSGGVLGGGTDPAFSAFGASAKFTFGGLAEGATSAAFWFTHPLLDMSSNGTVAFPVGDGLAFSLSTTVGTSANATLQVIPVPAAVWLFGSGLVGLAGLARRRAI